jgi:hypothetical protein
VAEGAANVHQPQLYTEGIMSDSTDYDVSYVAEDVGKEDITRDVIEHSKKEPPNLKASPKPTAHRKEPNPRPGPGPVEQHHFMSTASSKIPTVHRNILLLGKVGMGKKTIANRIAGETVFQILPPNKAMAREPTAEHSKSRSKSGFYFLLFDTREKNTTRELVNACTRDPQMREGVTLIILTVNNSTGTHEDTDRLEEVIKNIIIPGPGDSRVSIYLVITGCEQKGKREKTELCAAMKKSPLTRDIAQFVDEIIPVGFPSEESTEPEFMEIYRPGIEESERLLQAHVNRCVQQYNINHIFKPDQHGTGSDKLQQIGNFFGFKFK